MIDRSIRGPFDEMNTPPEAIEPLVWYLMNSPSLNSTGYEPVIWEPSPGDHWLTEYLYHGHGLKVIETSGNYFDTPFPQAADILVTNPPYSKKIHYLAKAREEAKPFALLLPITTLGVRRAHPSLEDMQIIFLKRRIDFTGKKRPWFTVAWFTWGLKLGSQLVFPRRR